MQLLRFSPDSSVTTENVQRTGSDTWRTEMLRRARFSSRDHEYQVDLGSISMDNRNSVVGVAYWFDRRSWPANFPYSALD